MAMAAPRPQGGPSSAIVPLAYDQAFSVTEAPYALNRDRLLENLASEASSEQPSVVVEVNNSGGNVNLQCSPAFLHAIVMPTLLTLGFPYTRVVTNLVLSLASPGPVHRQHRLHPVRPPPVHLLLQHPLPTILGNISVHIHYTTRKVQVQGSTLTPDGRTAAGWWLEEEKGVLQPRLVDLKEVTASEVRLMVRVREAEVSRRLGDELGSRHRSNGAGRGRGGGPAGGARLPGHGNPPAGGRGARQVAARGQRPGAFRYLLHLNLAHLLHSEGFTSTTTCTLCQGQSFSRIP